MFIFAIGYLTAILLLKTVNAEPHFAYRGGLKCSACHVNNSGGGMRNQYGTVFPQTEFSPLIADLSDGSMEFHSELAPGLSLGADLEVLNETLLSVKENGYEHDTVNSFNISTGNLYIEAQLVSGRLSLYFDETVAPSGATNREAFALFEQLPVDSYVKIGRMFVPYGIRVGDDETFVRQVTGFNLQNQDLGVEVGFEPGSTSISVAITNGTQGRRDDNPGKQVSTVVSYYLPNLVVGGSFAINEWGGIDRTVFGPYAAATSGPVTVMGEVDWVDESGNHQQKQMMAFASLEVWLRRSINARLAFDLLDPYDDVKEDEKSRVSIGFDAFLTSGLAVSAYYRIKNSIPQDRDGNTDGLTFGLHAFF